MWSFHWGVFYNRDALITVLFLYLVEELIFFFLVHYLPIQSINNGKHPSRTVGQREIFVPIGSTARLEKRSSDLLCHEGA